MRQIITLSIIAIIALLLPACGNHKRFDSAAWLKADSRERGRMSHNLVDNKVLVGTELGSS